MSNQEIVLASIYRAIDELNELEPTERRIEKMPDTPLYGPASVLDSLGLVNLIIAIENEVDESCGATLTIADERAMSRKESPFRTIQSLADYIVRRLEEGGSA